MPPRPSPSSSRDGRRAPSRWTGPASRTTRACSLLLAAALASACSDATGDPAGGERLDLTGAVPAAFEAHGSVEQVWLEGATPGQTLRLLDADERIAATGTSDAHGTLIFRDVPAAAGYRVAAGEPGALAVTGAFAVRTAADVPDPAFYEEQRLGPGYQYLTTRDGTKLAVNVILPGPIDKGPYPTVVEYSGYDPANPDSPQPSSLIASVLGYAVVGVNIRGIGCSGGAFQFFETLQSTDGYDVIEVVAAQRWVKFGMVGMVGLSYPGISQLFTAQMQPPHLASIAPLSVIADTGRGTLFPGGIFNNGFARDWAVERGRDSRRGGQAWSQKRMDEGDQVCIDNQRLRDQTPDILQLIEENRFYHAKIADQVSPATFVDKIQVPVFLAGAFQDEQTGAYAATMLDRFTGTDEAHFTWTNGNHTEPFDPTILSRWTEFLAFHVAHEIPRVSPVLPVILQTIGDQVFHAGGFSPDPARFDDASSYEEARARYRAEPRVRLLWENGAGAQPGYPIAGFESTFDAWPIPGTVPTTWYLDADGALSPTKPGGDGVDAFVYDPSRSQQGNAEGGSSEVWLVQPRWNWRQAAEGTLVAYETEPLAETLAMAGSGSVDLWIGSTAPDTDIQVTLSEVRPDGQETYVQNGWLRASRRRLDESASSELRPVATHREEDAEPIPAGQLVLARVEVFPFAHVFRAGSRLRLQVGAPGGDRAIWRFEALPAEGTVVNRIGRSSARASRIVLPVLPGIEVPTPLPACPALRGQPCRSFQPVANSPG